MRQSTNAEVLVCFSRNDYSIRPKSLSDSDHRKQPSTVKRRKTGQSTKSFPPRDQEAADNKTRKVYLVLLFIGRGGGDCAFHPEQRCWEDHCCGNLGDDNCTGLRKVCYISCEGAKFTRVWFLYQNIVHPLFPGYRGESLHVLMHF